MRRFSSEGSLLCLDIFPWKSGSQREACCETVDAPKICATPPRQDNNVDVRAASLPATPDVSQDNPCRPKKELFKDLSLSVEDLTDLDIASGLLKVTSLNESFKAYSDSQLAQNAISSGESIDKDDVPSPCSLSTSTTDSCCDNSGAENHQSRHHVRAKLSSAKLHLKSLFGQSPQVSNPSPVVPDPSKQESSAKQRRSHFTKQWSQVGHAKTRLGREEMEKWAESIDVIFKSRVALSVFGAFLRSEFCEENLQFYLACEQYRQSSNTFSLSRRAKEIAATYIQPGAPREVNLDSKTRDLTLQLLKAPSHSSLCHAQKRIRSLLEFGCYPRFLQSNIYLRLLEKAH